MDLSLFSNYNVILCFILISLHINNDLATEFVIAWPNSFLQNSFLKRFIF